VRRKKAASLGEIDLKQGRTRISPYSYFMGRAKKALLVCLGLLCASCATSGIQTHNSTYSPGTGERINEVARRPFTNFGLFETEIPPDLVRISAGPYSTPPRTDCASLRAETDAITRMLGPDIGPVSLDKKGNIVSDGSQAAWATARGAAEGWIPFHGVVREISGAARHDRLVERAILSGYVRRAFLRGLMEARCPIGFAEASGRTPTPGSAGH